MDISSDALRNSISIENPSDSRILEISVQNADPEMAKKIVDEIANVASNYIGDKMEVIPPKIIETGKIPTVKSEDDIAKYLGVSVLAVVPDRKDYVNYKGKKRKKRRH